MMKDGLVSDSAEAPPPEKVATATADRGHTSAAKGKGGSLRLLGPLAGIIAVGAMAAAQFGNTAAEGEEQEKQTAQAAPPDMDKLTAATEPSSGAVPPDAGAAVPETAVDGQALSEEERRRIEEERAWRAEQRQRREEDRLRGEQERQRRLAEALAEKQRRERAPVMVLSGSGTAPRAAAPRAAAADRGDQFRPGRQGDGDASSRQGSGIARDLEASDIVRVSASRLPNRGFTIEAGTQIPCTLQTALDSTLSGLVSCLLPYDVRSATGQVVLLEKGTRVLGEYRGGIQQGEARIFVVWNRAVSPNGVAVNLASPAADSLGRSGVDGEVENFFFKRFGGALLLSLVGDASTALSNSIAGVNQTINAPNQATSEVLRNDLQIRPVLRAAQGSAVTIVAARDLDFSNVYSLRLKR